MKRNSFIALLCAVLMIAGTTACEPEIIPTPDDTEQEENKDQNDVPTDEEAEEQVNTGVVRSMAFVSASSDETLKQATVQLASKGLTVKNGTYTGTGVFLNLVIRTEKDEAGVVYLAEGEYAAAENTAEELTWQVTAKDGEALTGSYVVAVIKGEATEVELTEGTATVSKGTNAEGAEEYTIVVKADKYDLTYTGAIEGLYVPAEPEPDQPAEQVSATFTGFTGWVDYTGWGNPMVGFEIFTDGCTIVSENWQYTTHTGNGYLLKLELYSADGTVAPGDYVVSTELGEGKCNAGNAMGGTEFFKVVDGNITSVGKITDGTIKVEKTGDTYKLTINTSLVQGTYEGSIGAPTAEPKPEQPAEQVSATFTGFKLTMDYTGWGMPMVAYDLYSEGCTVTTENWVSTYTGNGYHLKLEIYSADGTLAEGTYEAETAGATLGEFKFKAGDATGGTELYKVVDGTATSVGKITDGTIEVKKVEDTYQITINTSLLKATYGVPAEEPGQPEGGEEEAEVLTLTKFLNLTNYNTENTGNLLMIGVEVGTDGMVREPWAFGEYSGVNIKGTGHNLKLEFYSADGKLAPGTYVPAATQGTPAEGEFNFGYDVTNEYNGQTYSMVYGSSLVEYASDQQVSTTKITDGTITVAVEDDVYTIELNSSALNAKYVGKLSAE